MEVDVRDLHPSAGIRVAVDFDAESSECLSKLNTLAFEAPGQPEMLIYEGNAHEGFEIRQCRRQRSVR